MISIPFFVFILNYIMQLPYSLHQQHHHPESHSYRHMIRWLHTADSADPDRHLRSCACTAEKAAV